MITRAITPNRRLDHNFYQIRSNQSMVTGNHTARKSQQNITAGFQSQT